MTADSSQTTEEKPIDPVYSPEALKILRSMIVHEDDLRNQRLGYFLTLNGFLFAGLRLCVEGSERAPFADRVLDNRHARVPELIRIDEVEQQGHRIIAHPRSSGRYAA